LTFCRGRSHDEHYFNNPRDITGDLPPTPVLSMDEERIFKRVMNKYLLAKAFSPLALARAGSSKSTHGELGDFGSWPDHKKFLKKMDSKKPRRYYSVFK